VQFLVHPIDFRTPIGVASCRVLECYPVVVLPLLIRIGVEMLMWVISVPVLGGRIWESLCPTAF
jgi:hypothetical protein